MRTTFLMGRDRRLADLRRAEARLETAQDRISSGKRITRPSDAPEEVGRLLQLRSERAELEQTRAGIDQHIPQLQSTEATLGDLSSTLQTARTLSIQAGSLALGDPGRESLADEVERLRTRALSLSNSRSTDGYLFAGTRTDSAPFEIGPPVAYQGSTTPLQMDLGAETRFDASVTGDRVLNSRGGQGGDVDLFQNLGNLAEAIRAGDSHGVSRSQEELDIDLRNIGCLRADAGSRIQYVQLARQRVEAGIDAVESQRSELEDSDLPATIIELRGAELAHQAGLSVIGRLGQVSLLDYLR